MFLARMSINRPVMTTMAIVVFLIFGALSWNSLNLNQTPVIEIPFITVQTIYPGAGPKEIETQITKKIEDAVATVSQIKKIESYSLDGVSIVMIEFQLDKDINIANDEVKGKVDVILNELPDDAKLPLIQKFDIQAFPIIDVILSGELDSRELFEFADKTLKDRFAQIAGVGKVDLIGGQEREIHIELDSKTVFENMVSLPQLIQILKAHNFDIPGGYFKQADQEYTVRLSGVYPDPETIRELEVPTAFGMKKLRQIARVIDGGSKIREKAIYYNRKTGKRDANAIRLSIVKSPDGNAVEIAGNIADALPEIEKILPDGAKLEVVNDNSRFIRSTYEDTMSNIYLGVLFTSLVLLLFLHDWRSTLIVAMSMPTSILSTFLLVSAADFTLNMMSLMGLSVSVGVLVSNSVVVLENIFRHKGLGKKKKAAAFIGTSEVTVAVLAATMTNIVVFVPLASIDSIVGKFLMELALTATFATIFSLFMSFTLTPMLASKMLPNKQKTGPVSRALDRFEAMWARLYQKSLEFVLSHYMISLSVIAIAVAAFIFSLIFYASELGNEFMPTSDDGKIKIEAELPEGYNLEATEQVMKSIEERIIKDKDVKHLVTNLGKTTQLSVGTNLALMEIHLVDRKDRELGIKDKIAYYTELLSDVPNAKLKIDVIQQMGGGESPIEFFLLGQDLAQLEIFKDQIYESIKGIPGLINLDHSSRSGKPEISITPKRKEISATGLTVMDIAITLRSAIEGMVSSQYKEAGNEYDIKVKLSEESTNSPEKIKNIPIVSQRGAYRLSQLCDIKYTNGFSKILHRDKFTAIKFTAANAPGTPTGNLMEAIDKKVDALDLPAGYRIKWSGSSQMQKEMMKDLGFAFLLAIVLTFMLLAAILESFVQPAYILFTIVLGMIGVFASLYYLDIAMGITSNMGIIMLIGIVVNNAILILDYTNQLERDKGYHFKKAMIEAAPTKLKPITMSTLAIMLGMLPMALGMGDAGREMRIPLGVVSIGGLASSAILTLWVIPAIYYVGKVNSKKLKEWFKIKDKEEEPAV